MAEKHGLILDRSFYERPTVEVARDLLGKILIHGKAAGRIVEVEAYLGLDDRVAHASRGLTQRTKVVFGPPGHAYVYLIYGMYECLNLVAEPEGLPGCVLIRAIEPLAGIEAPAAGPGKLTRAMGITRRHNGADVTRGALTVRRLPREPAFEVNVTPRIGIRQEMDRLLRFLVAGSRFLSR